MAGYIGSKSSVTQVDGYTEAEADAEFVNDPSSVITVDGSNVGIGTSSPEKPLHINSGTGNIGVRVESSDATSSIEFMDSGTTSTSLSPRVGAIGDNFFVQTSGSERMRIDSSGNVLVGKTSTGFSAEGHKLGASGESATFTRSGTPMFVRRNGSDGSLIEFYKDGTTVGSIGNRGDSNLSILFGFSDDGYGFTGSGTSTGAILPCDATRNIRDNYIDLGYASGRFDDIYATNGTIQTSDFNEKQDIASLTATEMLVGARISTLFKTFRWKDSVAENGDNARTHTGVIAQDVQAAFTAEGLDAGDYALFISSTWWETQTEVPAVEAVEAVAEVTDEDGNVTTEAVEAVEAVDAYTRTDTYDTEAEAPEGATSKTRMGIRYPELLSFVAAYNEQRFASIEARLTALEA